MKLPHATTSAPALLKFCAGGCFFLLIALILAGCGGDESIHGAVDKIVVIRGADQCALPGEKFAEKLRVELFGRHRPGVLGGKGSAPLLEGVDVRFAPAPGSDLVPSAGHCVTDAGGTAAVELAAGRKVGDQYLVVSAGRKSVLVRFVTGVKISGAGQEALAGHHVKNPVGVRIVRDDGQPAVGVPVYFKLGATPEGNKTRAAVSPGFVCTDARGEAATSVKLGGETGEYRVNVEVADPKTGYFVRAQSVRVLGLNFLKVLITVAGGLALFIYGMKLMSDGLQTIAGERMRKILQFFARNRVVAMLAGALVTAVIQASGATTVMVIGFVNAGLLSLTQAIGIIFGANIGTTVTAQLISFNLDILAFPAIALGLLVTLSKKRVLRGWGWTIFGFGLLFFGMGVMSSELKVLGNFPSFVAFFRRFDCSPVNGIMPPGAVLGALTIGVIMTVAIQSSSAAMGVVLALAAGNLINFYTSIPLLLGTNIGTTFTAVFASLGANRVAKQAALAHILFNCIGAVIALVLCYIPCGEDRVPLFLYMVNISTAGNALAPIPQNLERHIAMAHTLFNVFTVFLLLPFTGVLARLCAWILPAREERFTKVEILEPHLLATPSIALEQSVAALRTMVEQAWTMVDRAVNEEFLSGRVNTEAAEELARMEDHVDEMQSKITEYLVQITRRPLTEPQSALVPLLLHCTNDAERIGDHAENILVLTERLARTGRRLSEQGRHDMKKLWGVLSDQYGNVKGAISGTELYPVQSAMKDEKKVNKLAAKYEEAHVERLRRGDCNLIVGVIFVEMLNELEKIGDHLSNIAERAPEIQKHYIELQ